jgi:cytochrome d ubiquinol oxidase subunit II
MGTLWFWIVAVMLVAYVVMDGFDIGVGIVYLIVARTEEERQQAMRAIGPFWDGNEVWLLAAGGTLFFAFPLLYASAFSGFYLPLMIVLWLLILRALSIELRGHSAEPLWRSFFDGLFMFSSVLLAIFYGAALANVVRGVPLGADNYFFLPLWTNWQPGSHPGILDWYTVTGGVMALVALAVHGAAYLTIKTEGDMEKRSRTLAKKLWPVLLLLTVVGLPLTVLARPHSLDSYNHHSIAFIVPTAVFFSLVVLLMGLGMRSAAAAFIGSSLYLATMMVGAVVGLYPVLLPAVGGGRDITIALALAGPHTLHVGLVWWTIGILLATMYFVIIHWLFRGKVAQQADGYGH